MEKICIQIPAFTKKNGTKVASHQRCYPKRPLSEEQQKQLDELKNLLKENDKVNGIENTKKNLLGSETFTQKDLDENFIKKDGLYFTKNGDLILFRHHSDDLESLINNSKGFELDMSRRFNQGEEVKNSAQLSFYSSSIDGAEGYMRKAGGDKGDLSEYTEKESTKLRTYVVDKSKLINLSKKEDRAKLSNTIDYQIEQDKAIIESSIKWNGEDFTKKHFRLKTTPQDVIDDNIISGRTYWDQTATDFGAGTALKKDLKKGGYNGIFFTDLGGKIEVALITPAKNVSKIGNIIKGTPYDGKTISEILNSPDGRKFLKEKGYFN